MSLINLTVTGAYKTHIPWTVIQVETGLTFSSLFSKIVAGAHPRHAVDEELSHYSSLDKVHIGLTKDSALWMSSSTSTMFAQCLVSILSSSCHRLWPWFVKTLKSASASSTLPNAFEVLIASQKTVERQR